MKQRYSYLTVSNCGTPKVNGRYYPVGILHGAFVWENNHHIYLTKESIDASLGWKITNLRECYYINTTYCEFPPNTNWVTEVGMDPPPSVTYVMGGDHPEYSIVKKNTKLRDHVCSWKDDLLPTF